SRYAEEAFSTHPPVEAFFLTADRLHRCGRDSHRYRRSPEDPLKLHDPVPVRARAGGDGQQVALSEEWRSVAGELLRHDDSGTIAVSSISDLLLGSFPEQNPVTDPLTPNDDVVAAQRQLRFADELRAAGEFSKAVVEYLRFLSFFPNSP